MSSESYAKQFWFAFAAAFTVLCLTTPLQAADRASLTNFDKRISAAKAARPRPEQRAAHERLKQFLPDAVADFDPVLGSPKWVRSAGGFLTDANGEGRGVSGDSAKRFENDPEKVLKAFLQEHRALFRHGPEVLNGAVKKREHTNAVRTVVWEQQVDGIPVYDSVLVANTTRRGELISISSQFVPEPTAAADRGTPNRAAKSRAPRISAERALRIAATNVSEEISEISALDAKPAPTTLKQRFKLKPLPDEANAALVWLPLDGDTLRLCWEVELSRREFKERFRFLVDAETGEVLVRRKLTVEVSEVLFRVYTSDSPSPMSPGLSVPTNLQPPYVERQLLAISNLNATASPLGWLNDGVMETRGNNVDAHLDRDNDDRADLPRPRATLDSNQRRVFDFPVDFKQHPTNYADAAVVQLFYWCNFMHDKLYELGFTENAGNFQKDNFGRGGVDNDAISADAQDGSGFNNANFTPARDGGSAKIQMYIFNGPTPARDGDFDAEVVCHEYAHGLTDRLVGGGVGLDFNYVQTGGMGEGWSDFYAESLLSEFGDDLGANYPMGGYASYLFNGLAQNYYFGIRRYPYTTNMDINPLTFKDIDPAQASLHLGIPRNPVAGGSANEVHREGEVWCTMLWDMRASLLRKYAPTNAVDFTNANMRVLRYVTLGLQLSPPNPSFLQARDAILLAARSILGSGSDTNEIWSAFARRGLGKSAICPDSSTTQGIAEAFDTPEVPEFDVLPHQTFFNIVGAVGGPFGPSSLTNVLVSSAMSDVRWSAAVSVPWLQLSLSNGVLAPHGSVESVVSLTSAANALPLGTFQGAVFYTNVTRTQVVSQVISLFVVQSPGDSPLVVTPSTTFFSQGRAGGPFAPSEQSYRLDNEADKPVNWTAVASEKWLTIVPTNGTLGATPQFTNVTVTVNSNANLLFNGTYSAVVTFVAGNTGSQIEAPVTLRVGDSDAMTEQFLPGAHPFDLQYSTVTFTPDLSASFYRACREPADAFPTDPAGGTVVSLNDDNYEQVTLTGGRQVSLYGSTSNAIFIGANGNLTLDPGPRTDFFYPGFEEYFSAARIAPLYVDLNPSNTTSISYLQLSNRFVVTYDNVSEFGAGNSNSFQVEMFYDGVIRVTWLRVDATNIQSIISGLSRGEGVPPQFVPSDLSAANGCFALATLLLPTSAIEGDGTLHGTVLLDAPLTNDLFVTLTSSDPEEVSVPDSIVITSGQTSFRFGIGVIDDGIPDGSQPVIITATFPDRPPASARIIVHDAETAALRLSVPYLGREGEILIGAGEVTVVTPGFTAERPVTVNLTSENPARAHVPPTITIQPGRNSATFDIALVDNNVLDGDAGVGITATVVNWIGDSDFITVEDNESTALGLTFIGDVNENQGTIVNGGTVSFSGVILSNVVVALQSEQPGLVSVPAFVTNSAGQSKVSFNLFVGDNGVTNGFDGVKIYASAAGFITATGFVAVIDDERPVVPSAPTPADLATHVARDVTLQWAVKANTPSATRYDVYFSTSAVLTASHLIASTNGTSVTLPRLLDPDTTYYWRVVATLAPFPQVESPIWRFTTETFGFQFDPVGVSQFMNETFPISLTARDGSGAVVSNYSGSVALTNSAEIPNRSTIVVAAIDTGTAAGMGIKRIEFANVSRRNIDVTGWQVAIYDMVSWPDPRTIFIVPGPSVAAPGDVFHLHALPQQFFPGSYPTFATGVLLAWNSSAETNPVAVLVLDRNGNVVDFVCAGADPSLITAPISSAGQWNGPAIAANTDASLTYQRIGNQDRNGREDFIVAPRNIGTNHAALLMPFTSRAPIAFFSSLNNFVGGTATGMVTMLEPGHNVVFGASDGRGHGGISDPIEVSSRNDLSLAGAAEDVVLINQPMTYLFTITNTGPNAASAVTLTDTLSSNSTFVAANSSQGGCSFLNGVVTCNVGAVGPQQFATVSVTAFARSPGVLTNLASVTRGEPDAYSGNNSLTQITAASFPQISISDVTNSEPNTGTVAMTFTLQLSRASLMTSTVAYATSDGTARAGMDYQSASGVVTFPPGTTNQTISVLILGDELSEPNETFFLNLTNASYADLSRSTAVGTISDNDPLTGITVTDVTVTEGNAGTANAVFVVGLTGASGRTVSLSYATANNTALAGLDYVETYGTLQFAPGVTNATVTIPILGDTMAEPTKSFFLNLINPVNATFVRSQGVGTIIDNDVAAIDHFTFDAVAPLMSYAGTPLAVTITARDGNGAIATGFNGPVALLALETPRAINIGAGTNAPWALPLGTSFHDARVQSIYQTNEIGGAGQIVGLALDVATPPSQMLNDWTIRMRHTPLDRYFLPAWEEFDWMTNFQHDVSIVSTGWVVFPFATPFPYNGRDHLMVDFSFDNSSFSADGICRSTTTPQMRSVYLRTDSAFGRPLDWMGNTPAGTLAARIPNIRLIMAREIPLQPAALNNFVNGVWSGTVKIGGGATDLVLRAVDAAGHIGESNPFASAVLRVDGISRNGSTVTLSFPTLAGSLYVVESSAAFGGSWTTISNPITGDGKIVQFSYTSTAPQQYYRVRLIP